MTAAFAPSRAEGMINAPPSKTLAHRELIAAALSEESSVVSGLTFSEDISATVDCARSLGAGIERIEDAVRVTPNANSPEDRFPCRESGSSLRFFLPLALTRPTESVFSGSERLLARPLGVYEDLCRERGLLFERRDDGIHVRGPLEPGRFRVRGDVSSQFITGLLFALPLLDGNSVLEILPPLVSAPYLDVTLAVLTDAGIRVEKSGPLEMQIPGRQRYLARDVKVEGDYSNAAFLEAFNLLGGDVKVENLPAKSFQGDRAYRDLFPLLAKGPAVVDVTEIPDLAPVLMALGGALWGVTLTGTDRLRTKESDRGAAMAGELAKFGVRVAVGDDRIDVFPAPPVRPTEPVGSHNDHRVAMACSLLLTRVGGVLTGAEAVRKSYPGFFEDLEKIGVSLRRQANIE